jgi:hypothetical protein
MFSVLIDACAWLDMAQDPKQAPLLLVVENMVRQGLMRLVVPRVVIDEFKRNRARVVLGALLVLGQLREMILKGILPRTAGSKKSSWRAAWACRARPSARRCNHWPRKACCSIGRTAAFRCAPSPSRK